MAGIYDSFGFLFTQASQMIQDHLRPALTELGLIPKQMGLMLLIEEQPGISQKEAGAVQRLDRTTMTQQIDHLEGAGYVERVARPSDRRAYGLYLTEKGTRTVAELWGHINSAHSDVFAKLSAEQVESMKECLHAIVKG